MAWSALLLAAGKGIRYRGSKQNELFHDKELWLYAYETVRAVMEPERIIVVGKDIEGGVSRSGSVLNGLRVLPADTDPERQRSGQTGRSDPTF